MGYKYKINVRTGQFDQVLDESMIHMQDAVATYNSLPTTGNAENDARFVKDTDILYVWSISSATGNLTDWKETAKLSVADLDALPDGSTYGRIKNTEILSGQVKRLDDGTNEVTAANAKDAVDKKHSQNTDTDLDATFEATFVKKVDNVNVLADITSAGADIEDAVTKKHSNTLDHTQGTDQKLDDGGANEVTVANVKDAVDKKHYRSHAMDDSADHHFATMTPNNLMDANGSGLPRDSGIASSDVSDAVTKKHTQNTDTILTTNGTLELFNAGYLKRNLLVDDTFNIQIDEIRARDGDGLKLYDDSGAAGIFVEDGGQVGIGTTSPRASLEISGGGNKSLYIVGGTDPRTIIGDTTDASDYGELRWDTIGKYLGLDANSTRALVLQEDGGNVGINVTDPDPNTKLEVLYAGTQVMLSYDGSNYFTFATQSDGDMTLDSNKASYNLDFGDGNLITTGELKIKVYAQDAEPTLNADEFMAIWKDTNDSNRIYLLFRRGVGDQVAVELA